MRFYGLPEPALAEVAERIGPKPDDILGEHHVPEELVAHFDRRAGYLRSADPVFADELDAALEPDLAPLVAATR